MRRISLYYIVVLISIALLVLVGLQLYQAKQLYNQTLVELNTHIENVLSKVAIRHEKADDFKRYTKFFDKDFSSQYKLALKQEFQNLVPVQETVSIRDTFIQVDGRKAKYLYIEGQSYDSISDVKAKHSVLARDISEMSHLIDAGSNHPAYKNDSSLLGYQIDKKVITSLFKKSKYVNEMMVNAFRGSDFLAPEQRIDLPFLDSIISFTFNAEKLPPSYKYHIIEEDNTVLSFTEESKNYANEMDTTRAFSVRLFPGNIFDETLRLVVTFPQKGVALFGEMWLTLLVSVFLIILIVASFYVMFKTIINQRRLAEVKNDFISNMTHEFKTPISTISLACEAMNDHDMISAEERQSVGPYVNMITEENKRLSSLVERILQSAILDRGELKLKSEPLELNEIVSMAVQKAKIRIPKGKGSIKLEQETGLLPFKGDQMHTTNLVSNLIDNAIKYSKSEIDIFVKTKKIEGGYQLEVSDKGIGIKNEHLDKIFDKLYRVPTGNVHDVKGFGLGLSYVKAITDLEGWKISVKSKFGEGSTFILKIIKEQKNG